MSKLAISQSISLVHHLHRGRYVTSWVPSARLKYGDRIATVTRLSKNSYRWQAGHLTGKTGTESSAKDTAIRAHRNPRDFLTVAEAEYERRRATERQKAEIMPRVSPLESLYRDTYEMASFENMLGRVLSEAKTALRPGITIDLSPNEQGLPQDVLVLTGPTELEDGATYIDIESNGLTRLK